MLEGESHIFRTEAFGQLATLFRENGLKGICEGHGALGSHFFVCMKKTLPGHPPFFFLFLLFDDTKIFLNKQELLLNSSYVFRKLLANICPRVSTFVEARSSPNPRSVSANNSVFC